MEDSKANPYEIEEPSNDLLKNTPSNIARLEDVIDHCKGRQKYLAQTTSPSDGEDVRWYFCEVPLAENELAASVPRTEIVGKGDYFRFGMRDSLAMEASFLQREEELLSIWWKEYGECSVGPSGCGVNIIPDIDLQPKSSSLEGDPSTCLHAVEEERVGVPVKGGLYEVDLAKRHCFPVYWNGENRRVLRGHWFARKAGLDWLPLREDVAEQLEFAYRCQVWHRRTFQPSGLFAARVDLQGSMMGLHALFTGEDNTWEAWLNVDASGFSNVINIRGNGIKLRRGYSPSGSPKPTQDELRQQKEEEMDDYCSQVPVQHLVFMVHGIGQRLEKANLVDDVGNFRQITASLAERHLTSYQRDTQRVLFIPCQWRRGLKLGGESAVDNITLNGVRGLRVMLSATALDILYYMSPIYCQEIINSVSNQLNRLYKKFLKRNPDYNGKVSIYAHSLGSVLSYDILCHQDDLSSPFPMECMYKENVKAEANQPDKSNESPQFKSRMNSESKSSSTTTENLEPMFQKGDSKDPYVIAHGSPTSDLQKVSSRRSSDNVSELCERTLETKQATDWSSEDDVQEQSSNDMLPLKDDHMVPTRSMSTGDIGELQDTTSDLFQQSLESKQVAELLSQVDVGEQISSDIPPFEENCVDSTSSNNNGPCSGDVDKLQENTSDNANDTEKVISLLREEVDSLKARLLDLESRHGHQSRTEENHQDEKEVAASTRNQYCSQRFTEKVNMDKSYTRHIKYTKLEFKVDTFFAVGSPLGVFLALRNVRIGIEPLVCKEFVNKRPVIIPYHRGGKRLHIGFQDFTEDLSLRSQAVVNHLNSVRVKVLTACQSKKNDSIDEGTESSSETEERSYGSVMMERVTGSKEGRIDHVLQDKTFQHQYISAIGSHTNYWRDYDTALFILKHLYREIPEEPDSPVQLGENSSNNQTRVKAKFFQSDTVDDDLPLTFSEGVVVKEFSRKVRKAMKNP
ncbi:hypothetical protein AQUCO_00300073v1 [Aquilegia coerulea]|uniref:DDHD domain-containing protein n=1 Tax=Aquilegia coerulea TaxID=218851 RepID=A0A2G5EX20_AQUCA|nr:hypothetical protein AQUCO_00300073v1 [Aquilegia coerulea]